MLPNSNGLNMESGLKTGKVTVLLDFNYTTLSNSPKFCILVNTHHVMVFNSI